MGYGATDSDDRSHPHDECNSSVDFSDDDLGIIPKGALDPVYEAKAHLLNSAVSHLVKIPTPPVFMHVWFARLPTSSSSL